LPIYIDEKFCYSIKFEILDLCALDFLIYMSRQIFTFYSARIRNSETRTFEKTLTSRRRRRQDDVSGLSCGHPHEA